MLPMSRAALSVIPCWPVVAAVRGAKPVGGKKPVLRNSTSHMNNEDVVTELAAMGIASIVMAFAASLLDRPVIATLLTILGAFALSMAITKARDGR